jgi:hypothetical protein
MVVTVVYRVLPNFKGERQREGDYICGSSLREGTRAFEGGLIEKECRSLWCSCL